MPTVVARTAPSAGPNKREPVMTVVLNESTFASCSGGTISVTIVRRVGLSNAVKKPCAVEMPKSNGNVSMSSQSTRPSTNARMPSAPCICIVRRCRSTRSAIAPAYSPKNNSGAKRHAVTMPSSRPPPPSSRTSSTRTVNWAQVPILLMAMPPKKIRTLRSLNDRSGLPVFLTGSCVVVTSTDDKPTPNGPAPAGPTSGV